MEHLARPSAAWRSEAQPSAREDDEDPLQPPTEKAELKKEEGLNEVCVVCVCVFFGGGGKLLVFF